MIPYILVKTEKDAAEACEYLSQLEAIGLDTETTDLHPRNGELRLLQLSEGYGPTDKTFIFDLRDFPEGLPYEVLDLLEADLPRKIAHNGKFDFQWLKTKLGIEPKIHFDTYLADIMVATATLGINMYKHGLEHVVPRYLEMDMHKEEQRSDWSTKTLTDSQLGYAAFDAAVLPALRKVYIQKLTQSDLHETATLEFDAIPAVADLELNGFPASREAYGELVNGLYTNQQTTAKALQTIIGTTLPKRGVQSSLFEDIADKDYSEANLNSHVQIRKAFRKLGVPIFSPTDPADENEIQRHIAKKLPFATTTNKLEIIPLARKFPVLQVLLDHRGAEKLYTSYGQKVLEAIENDRIYASFWQIKAETGRMACSDPNLQQVPHGKEFRSCFIAPKGRKLIIADYSQIELRILADYCLDPILLKVFTDGLDLHSMTASKIAGVTYEELEAGKHSIYKAVRDFAKTLNFGIVYGMGFESYAQRTGRSLKDAESDLKIFKQSYKVMDNWLYRTGMAGLKSLTSRTRSGRLVKFFAPKTNEEEGGVRRNARNTPIQGTSADIIKVALRYVYDGLREAKLDAFLVHVVHDEIIVECDEAIGEEVMEIVVREMQRAAELYIKKVPVKVEAGICDNWSEK